MTAHAALLLELAPLHRLQELSVHVLEPPATANAQASTAWSLVQVCCRCRSLQVLELVESQLMLEWGCEGVNYRKWAGVVARARGLLALQGNRSVCIEFE